MDDHVSAAIPSLHHAFTFLSNDSCQVQIISKPVNKNNQADLSVPSDASFVQKFEKYAIFHVGISLIKYDIEKNEQKIIHK